MNFNRVIPSKETTTTENFKTATFVSGGFTLIELMIVVTIIGILASIAVPAYRDYTIRTRVMETTSAFYPVKTEMTVYYDEHRRFPTALASLTRVPSTPISYEGDYVASLAVNNGTVTVFLKDNLSKLGEAQGEAILFIASQGNTTVLNWSVSGSANMPEKYWP